MRKRIKEVTGKDYINSEQNTLDYVLLFIPSEPIYRFVLNEDEKVFHEALSNRVVLCSPLTLYSIVQVIRQATRNYRVEKNSREILNLLGNFTKRWAKYVEEMDKMGKSLDAARTHYDNMLGTRTRMLQVQMDKAQRLLVQTAKDDETVGIIESEPELVEELDD
ncbi:MAG: DNA recombination protein RmuC [Anaerolineae bacterium]|nr:DNA recombination protein RmuC [Anaerolineae bacterium]